MIVFDGKETYKGVVLSLYTSSRDLGYETVYHAIVWDWITLEPKSVCYGDTQGTVGHATIDATPQCLEFYNIYKANKDRNYRIFLMNEKTSNPYKGFGVRVTKGKLLPVGFEGIVTSVIDGVYGVQLIIKCSKGNYHRTYAKNVEVTSVPIDFFKLYPRQFYPECVSLA